MAARQKRGVLARSGQQVWLGQNLQNVLRLQRLDGRGQINVRPEEENIQQVVQVVAARRDSRRRRGARCRRCDTPVVVNPPFSDGGPNCWVEIVPIFFAPGRLRMFTPNWLTADRSTSANFTSSRISPGLHGGRCNQARDFRRGILYNLEDLVRHGCEDACPERITESFDVSICTCSFGNTS